MARFIVDIPTEEFKNKDSLSNELSENLEKIGFKLIKVQCVEADNSLQFYDEEEDRKEDYEGVYMYIKIAQPEDEIEVGDMFTSLDNINPNESLVLNSGIRVWNERDDYDLGQLDYIKILPFDKQ